MKKNLIAFLAILVGIFAILSFLDARGDYAAERIIWKANQRLRDAMQDPAAVPDNVYDKISKMYSKVIEKFPHSPLTSRAYILLARVDIVRGSYDEARKKLQVVFDKYPKDTAVCSEAAAEIGKSYEAQDDWKSAIAIYKKITRDYPTTNVGLMTPMYIANYYKAKNDTANANVSYNEAIAHYIKLSQDYPDSIVEFRALRLLSNCYIVRQMWEYAIDTMGEVLIKYPEPHNMTSTIQAINAIALSQPQFIDNAIQIYKNFGKKHGSHPVVQVLEEMISRLEEAKARNIRVIPNSNEGN